MGYFQHIAKIASPISRTILGKNGASFVTLVEHWNNIVGAQIAESCLPEKLVFPKSKNSGAVLHVITTGPAALTLQHSENMLLERINTALGYKAVEKLRYRHTQMQRSKTRKLPKTTVSDKLPAGISYTDLGDDQDLAQTLASFGKSIAGRNG